MKAEVRPAIVADALALAPKLREADKAEIAAHSGRAPWIVLAEGVRAGRAWGVFVDNEVVALYGVAPNARASHIGHPWLLASPGLLSIQHKFLRRCRDGVKEMGRDFDFLMNYVDARNTVHIKWLRWCGFEFTACHERFGVEQRPFLEFWKTCHV